MNHTKRHRLPVESFSCKTNNLEKYGCKDCDFEVDLMIIIKQHIREHHERNINCVQDQPKNDIAVKSYICQECSFETYSKLFWVKHLSTSCFNTQDFEKIRLVSCNDEQRSFKAKKPTTHKRKRFCCSHCKYKAKTENHLKHHVNYEHAALEVAHWFCCKECQFKSKSYFHLQRHKITHLSAEAVQWYSCDKCEYKTKQNYNLNQHKISKHSSNNELNESCSYKTKLIGDVINFKCNYCSFESKVLECLERHTQSIHACIGCFQCDICDFKTNYRKTFKCHKKKVHLDSGHDEGANWFYCFYCEYKTRRKIHLKEHTSLKHTGSEAMQWFTCDQCHHKFKCKSALSRHTKLHLSKKDIQWFRCDKCNFKTKQRFNIKQHELLKHTSVEEALLFHCEHCSYKTKLEYCLKRHIIRHKSDEEAEWFYCFTCEYKTKRKGDLKRHISSKHTTSETV
jgi:hypothetical protein